MKFLCYCSSFADIFDVDHFIDVLHYEVCIVKELPSEYSWSTREYYGTGIRATRIKTAPNHATADWYIENILPVLQRYVKYLTAHSAIFLPVFPQWIWRLQLYRQYVDLKDKISIVMMIMDFHDRICRCRSSIY